MIIEAQAASPKSGYFESLDSMRGICALFVALYHTAWASHFRFLPFVWNGWLFVDFFFILSGFVITHAYLYRVSSWRDISRFMIRRFFRLYPLHIFTFVISFAVAVIGGRFAFTRVSDGTAWSLLLSKDALQAAFLVHGLGFSQPTFNPPSWSISTEYWTYLFFALALLALKPGWKMLVFAFCTSVIFGTCFVALNQYQLVYQFGLLRCVAEFMCGVLTYACYQSVRPNALPTLPYFWLQLAAMFVAVSVLAVTPPFTVLNMLVVPAFMALLLFAALDKGSILKTALQSRHARFVGERSYSIYMVHSIVLSVVSFLVTRLAPQIKIAAETGGAVAQANWSCLPEIFSALATSPLFSLFRCSRTASLRCRFANAATCSATVFWGQKLS